MNKYLSTAGVMLSMLLGLGGCGAAQSAKDGALDAMKWAFTSKVKTMSIDVIARAAVNQDRGGRSLSTVVRIYQLKSAANFEKLDYAQLLESDEIALKPDLLARKGLVIGPDTSASIVEPMDADAQYVGIVAFFRVTGAAAQWKLVLPKKQWEKANPVRIELRDDSLHLLESPS